MNDPHENPIRHGPAAAGEIRREKAAFSSMASVKGLGHRAEVLPQS